MNELWLTLCFEKVNSIISRATRRLLESVCFEFCEFLIRFWIYMWLLLIMITFYLPSAVVFSIFPPSAYNSSFSPFFGWVSSLFCPLCLSLVSLVVSLSVCVQSPSLYLFTFVCVYSAFLFPVYFITCFFISHGPCLFLQSCPLVCLVSPCPVVLVPYPLRLVSICLFSSLDQVCVSGACFLPLVLCVLCWVLLVSLI